MTFSMRRMSDIFYPVGTICMTVHRNGELKLSENTLFPIRIAGYEDINKTRKFDADSYRATTWKVAYSMAVEKEMKADDAGQKKMYRVSQESFREYYRKAVSYWEGSKLLRRIEREERMNIRPQWAKDKNLADSLARSRKNLIEYCFNNQWTHFVTFTVNADKCDRYSLAQCNKKIGRVMNKYKERVHDDIRYIIVPEEHKDGAFHYHGLVYLPEGVEFTQVTVKGRKLDTIAHFTKNLGYNTFSKIKNQLRAAKYITKYISKQTKKGYVRNIREQIPDAKLLLHTRGLRKAMKLYVRTEPLPECVHKNVDPETGECKNTFQLWGACRTAIEIAKFKNIVIEHYVIDGETIFALCQMYLDRLRAQAYFDIAI